MIYKFNTTQPVDIAIFAGHGTSEVNGSFDPGAVGNGVKEHDIVKSVAEAVCNKLDAAGYIVFYDEQNFKDNDLKGVTIKSKYALSLHANAANKTAKGVEALVPAKEKHLSIEKAIVDRIAALGTSNRGLKSRDINTEKVHQRTHGQALNFTDYYGEIREAWKLGISLTILEMFFIDNAEDMAFFNKNKQTIINIITEEIQKVIKPTGKPTAPAPTPTPTPKKTYIQLGAHETSWRIYNVNGPYTAGKEIAKLAPSKFGGLEYEVIRWIKTNEIAVIQTEQFGQAAIYVAAGTGAKIVTK